MIGKNGKKKKVCSWGGAPLILRKIGILNCGFLFSGFCLLNVSSGHCIEFMPEVIRLCLLVIFMVLSNKRKKLYYVQ